MTQEPDGQLTLFAPDTWSGRTYPAPSPAPMERISVSCWRKPAELSTAPYLFLDLRAGCGTLLGALWEINSPSLGEYTTLNTGVSPSAAKGCTLSRILETVPHPKYYLSKTACLGILRRARKRGKDLPPVLQMALEIQAGIRST